VRLDDARGFVFDVDGTLVRRRPDGVEPMPGAVDVLDAIRGSGRPLMLFTNGSHVTPHVFAEGLRRGGLPVSDDEVMTPVCSALSYLARRHPGASVFLFSTDATRERMREAGVRIVEGDAAEEADVVFVAHTDVADLPELERAARAILRGAKLLTASYLPAYAGANGPIFSRGAMLTAAIVKATGARPTVVGKPSKAAVREVSERLGVAPEDLVVTGDDVRMDVGLGLTGGSRTILVRTGITGDMDLSRLPERRRPHAVVDGVRELLPWL
jgi:HAD superfamily hydrolase (TIGR01450 family)